MADVTPAQPSTVPAETNPAQEPSQTIFARNLPAQLSEMEFTMLFQKYPGFVSGRVKKNKEGDPIGFVEFDSIDHCVSAKNAVAHEQSGTGLVLEFSHTPRSRQNRPSFMHYPRGHKREYMPMMTHMTPPMPASMPPPSSTLFVSNVPPDATPREMSHIFRTEQGFRCLRFVPNIKGDRFVSPHSPFLCFVEFETPVDAGRALNNLQNYQMDLSIPNSPQLMITFARTQRKTRHM